MASAVNIAPVSVVPGRLSASALSKILLEATESDKVAIIDVRDDDHIGGHIRSSINVPSSTLDHALPSLVRRLADKETVVFHCALSQVRGPKAAAQYMRARERLLAPQLAGRGEIGEALVKSKAENEVRQGKGKDDKEAEWVDDEEVGEKAIQREQKVLVLDKGFEGWQEAYGRDKRLTENWSEALWGPY